MADKKITLKGPAWGLRLFLKRQTAQTIPDYFSKRPHGSEASKELVEAGLAKRDGDALVYTPVC